MRHKTFEILIGFLLLSGISSSYAKGTYQLPADFISDSFNSNPPQPQVLWLDDNLRQQVEAILAHKHSSRRIRYWKKDHRSVWVLDEIGKKKPITTGIVIENDRISQVKVLVFRETRGWEIKYPFFTRQFTDSRIGNNNELDRSIDDISGATLSVRAVTKLARIALLLHTKINHDS